MLLLDRLLLSIVFHFLVVEYEIKRIANFRIF